MSLTFDERRHVYKLDGVVLPGVTSILNVLSKPGLEAWQRRLGFAEADRVRDESAMFGTQVHAACEVVAKADRDFYEPGYFEPWLRPFTDAYNSWINANVHRVIAAEPRVASRVHGYAGSIDLVAEMLDGQTAVLDLKTGSQIPDTCPHQLTAYGRALLEQDGIQTTRRIAIHLPRKNPGELTVHEYPAEEEPEDWRVFLCCLILWRRFMAKKSTRPAPRQQVPS